MALPRAVTIVVVCVLIGAMTPAAQQPEPPQSARFRADELLVKFRPEASRGQRNARLGAISARLLRTFTAVDVDHIRLPPGLSVAVAMGALAADPDVLMVQPDYERQIVASSPPSDPYWISNALWGLQKIQMASVWNGFGAGDGSVVIADIDTGVNYLHPDLAANMWRNPGEIPGNGVDDDRNGHVDDVHGLDTYNNDSDPMDDHGHGTHTAGTFAAVGNNGVGVAGISWNAKILACKFLGASGQGFDSDAIACFNYLIGLRNRGVNVRVSNNSWGSKRESWESFPAVMMSAIDAMGSAGILSVFSAGNDGANLDATPFDPASIPSPSLVSVAASDQNDARPSFSNYGAMSVDLAAPGLSIFSTRGAGYAYLSGTSMAAPHVAGVAGLLLSLKPDLTVNALKAHLLNHVDRSAAWTGVVASGGRLNAYKSVLAALPNQLPTVTLTSPTNGASYPAPATVSLTANAADTDGTIAQVAFYRGGTLIGTDASAPFEATWSSVPAGSYTVRAEAMDNVGSIASASAAITVAPPPGPAVNIAAAANGAIARASSTFGSGYAPAAAINGDRKGANWGATGGWKDGTSAFPDWLEVEFDGMQTVNRIDVFSVQDAYQNPVEPTSTTTFAVYGLKTFDLQYWNGSGWATVPGGSIAGNTLVWRSVSFAPVTTPKIRVFVHNALANSSRITEVEAYADGVSPPALPPPSLGVNVAAAANGAIARASSTFGSGYAPAAAINGDRKGGNWGATGGWKDGTAAFPDWLEVEFSGAQTVNRIDVFSVQDAYQNPVEPTSTTTFAVYGLKTFDLQYWNGSGWATVPGGSIAGNTLVWRSVSFAPVTTPKIRVFVHNALANSSRITEVEAYADGVSPPALPPPSLGVNVAAAANGAIARASSTFGSGYAPAAAINGDRKGGNWGATGGWKDGTAAFPDWLEVEFSGAQTVNRIDVFSVQDAYQNPVEPTSTTTFAIYGLRTFDLQYWNGSGWATVPGGRITGNTLVWRSVSFAPVTTPKLRVLVHHGLASSSRITEVEAYRPQ